MKKLMLIVFVIGLSACAQQKKDPVWTMSWRCYTQYCYSHITPNGWGGNGSFSNESDCVAWEAIFLNTAAQNNGGTVSACTEN